MKFGIIGVAGYIAPRHLKAIQDLNHELIAAYDENDSVGIIDSYFPNCNFYNNETDFKNYIAKNQLDYISICSPNHLHLHHIELSLKAGANVICEKPLVLSENEIDKLVSLEKEHGKKVYTILQLRTLPTIKKFKEEIESEPEKIHDIKLMYITSRGHWYHQSWKGDTAKSGGLSTNIGIHFFDMLTWIFGPLEELTVKQKSKLTEKGVIKFSKAIVNWTLSVDKSLLPAETINDGKTVYRSIKVNNQSFDFSSGFTDQHTIVYKEILEGKGFDSSDAREAIKIVEQIRSSN